MRRLLLRNILLRKWTVALYLIILLLLPWYMITKSIYPLFWQTFIFLVTVIMFLESATAYRLFNRFGKTATYVFQHSLPVSRMQLLNSHYLTVLGMTVMGTIVLWGYEVDHAFISVNDIHFNFFWMFIAVNLFSFLFGFPKCSEKMNDHIPLYLYIITMHFLIPLVIGLGVSGYGMVRYEDPSRYDYINFGFWYFIVSALSAISMYFYQIIRLKRV